MDKPSQSFSRETTVPIETETPSHMFTWMLLSSEFSLTLSAATLVPVVVVVLILLLLLLVLIIYKCTTWRRENKWRVSGKFISE